MRPENTSFFKITTLFVAMIIFFGVFSSCAGKEPEPDTDTGGYETLENETHLYTEPRYIPIGIPLVTYEDIYYWLALQSEVAIPRLTRELPDTGFAEFVRQLRDGERDIPVPCRNGEPLTVNSSRILSWSYETFCRPCISYSCDLPVPDGKNTSVLFHLSFLTEEETQMAKEMSWSDSVGIMSRSAINTHNYQRDDSAYYTKEWEENVQMDGRSVSVLVRQWKDRDRFSVLFAYDDVFVDMYISPEVWNSGCFADFSIRPLTRPQIPAVTPLPDTEKSVQSNEYLTVGEDALQFFCISKVSRRYVGNWVMYRKPDGTIVNVWIDEANSSHKFIVRKIYEIPEPLEEPTPELFESISPGTPMNEVLRRAGIPSADSETMDYMEFTCSDGSAYRVYINERTAEEDGKTVLTGDWYVTWVRKVS